MEGKRVMGRERVLGKREKQRGRETVAVEELTGALTVVCRELGRLGWLGS